MHHDTLREDETDDTHESGMHPVADRTPESRTVTANGLRLRIHDWGGNGPPAVLFHATGFHGRQWDPIAHELAATHRVVAFDQRGHGDSSPAEDGCGWDRFVADAIALCDTLEIRNALAVGHSMGATVAAATAAERPDLFTRLVLIEMIFFLREGREDEIGNPIAELTRRRQMDWPDPATMIASYRPRPPFDTWTPEALRLYVEHGTRPVPGGVRLKCEAETEANIFDCALDFQIAPLLAKIEAPTLLIRGEDTHTMTDGDLARVLGKRRRGRSITASGTTHFVPMERPDWVVETIRKFLDEPPPPAELPVAVHGLAHLALRVRDVERSRRFYEEVFGMRVVWQPDADNVYLSSGRDNLALHRAKLGPPEETALDHLGFLVERPELVYAAGEALTKRGISLRQGPKLHRDDSSSLYLEDPDGNVIQILYTPAARLR